MARFEMQILNAEGSPIGEPFCVSTATGIYLQCPSTLSFTQVDHLCAIARQTPDYPVDLVEWRGPEGDKYINWNARIFWRE